MNIHYNGTLDGETVGHIKWGLRDGYGDWIELKRKSEVAPTVMPTAKIRLSRTLQKKN